MTDEDPSALRPTKYRSKSDVGQKAPLLFSGLEYRRRRAFESQKVTPLPVLGSRGSVNEESYPMYLLPVKKLLKMTHLPKHQDIFDELVVYNASMHGRIIFVSHQWMGFSEPDPENYHLKGLQSFLQDGIDGYLEEIRTPFLERFFTGENNRVTSAEMEAALPHMLIWMDYISMPQLVKSDDEPAAACGGTGGTDGEGLDRDNEACMDEEKASEISDHRYLFTASKMSTANDLANAVASIPSYVERSSLVIVLTPLCRHVDTGHECNYSTWRQRGWCRMEFVASRLAVHEPRVIVLRDHDRTPEFTGSVDITSLQAGLGNFTCCDRNHDFGHGKVPCDKRKVRSVLEIMLKAKISHLRRLGKLTELRALVVLRQSFLTGLSRRVLALDGSSTNGIESLDTGKDEPQALKALKLRLEWRDEEVEKKWTSETGYTLLMYACLANDLLSTRALLSDPDNPPLLESCVLENGELRKLGLVKGMNALIMAGSFASWQIIELLLDAGANPRATSSKGYDVIRHACAFQRGQRAVDIATAWLKRYPRWDPFLTEQGGVNALHCAVLIGSGKLPLVRFFLGLEGAKGKIRVPCENGATALHLAVTNEDREVDVITALIEADPACVHDVQRPTVFKWRLVLGSAKLLYFLGVRRKWVRMLGSWNGITPLHNVVFSADTRLIEVLIEAKADINAKNGLGMTPLEHASFRRTGNRKSGAPERVASLLRKYDANATPTTPHQR